MYARDSEGRTIDVNGAPPPQSDSLKKNGPAIAIGLAAVTGIAVLNELVAPSPDATSPKSGSAGSWKQVDGARQLTSPEVRKAYWEGVGTDPQILPPDVLGLKSPELKDKMLGAGAVVALGIGAVLGAAAIRRRY